RQIDPRKPNRRRKLLERAHIKLNNATSRQVLQILAFKELQECLSDYSSTLKRFQDNSSKLHRCLIKWDRLKSRDQAFTRKSVLLSLDLHRFIEEMIRYFGNDDDGEQDRGDGPSDESQQEVVEGTGEEEADDSTTEESFVEVDNPTTMTRTNVESVRNSRDEDERTAAQRRGASSSDSIGFRRSLMIKFKLSQLRFKTKTFNHQLELHEQRKVDLKVRGNRCIYEMVEDGKRLLEVNERLNEVVFELTLLR
ncbi:hypothetical protein BY996DRAFT_4576539, partial [Phakopsora pachyrhizi]